MRTEIAARKAFLSRFRRLARTHTPQDAWIDFLTVSLCSICWTDEEMCQAEIAAVEKRYQSWENELMAEMFALAATAGPGFLEDTYRFLRLGKASKRVTGLMRYIQQRVTP